MNSPRSPSAVSVSIPKRVSEALNPQLPTVTLNTHSVSIPKRVSEALNPRERGACDLFAEFQSLKGFQRL